MTEEIIKQNELLNAAIQIMIDKGADEARAYLESNFGRLTNPYTPRMYGLRLMLLAQGGHRERLLEFLDDIAIWSNLWFRPEFFNEKCFDFVRDEEIFKNCAAASEKRYQKVKDNAKISCTWRREESDKLLLALHGNHQSNEESAAAWAFMKGLGWQVECVQSSEPDCTGLYRWSPDGKGPFQLENICRTVDWNDYEVRCLAGFGTGCNIIARALAMDIVECELVIMHSPRLHMLGTRAEKLTRSLSVTGTKLVVTCGSEYDEGDIYAAALSVACKKAGIDAKFIEIPGLGHSFPENYIDIIKDYINI